MLETRAEDHINEALAILICLQSLLADHRDEVTLETEGLYVMLSCVVTRLRQATAA